MAEAREHFGLHCAACHGATGRGEGVFGRNMYPRSSELADPETQALTDGELYYVISEGVRFTGMPAFGDEDSPESIWNLVAFIRRIPKLSPEEVEALRRWAGEAGGQESGQGGGGAPEPGRPQGKPHSHAPGAAPHRH